MAKQIIFGEEVRHALKRGVDTLADAVKVTWDLRGIAWRWKKNGGHRQ